MEVFQYVFSSQMNLAASDFSFHDFFETKGPNESGLFAVEAHKPENQAIVFQAKSNHDSLKDETTEHEVRLS